MKKMLSVLLASATALSVCCGLAACGGDSKKTLTVWAPDTAHECYKALTEEFLAQPYQDGTYNDYFKVKFVAKPEGNIQTELGTDAAAGADLFFFEAGQVQNMITKNLLQPLPTYTAAIQERDSKDAVDTVLKDGVCYAFPATLDNGWFMRYDSDYYTADEVLTLDSMLAKAKKDGKKIMFAYNDGWYISSFFQGAGCTMDFVYNEDGTREYVTDIYTSENGKNAARAIQHYLNPVTNGVEDKAVIIKPSSDMNSEIPAGMKENTIVAGFIGTWVAKDMPTKAVPTKCPTFTCGGEQVQMGSFYGSKYCGVNPRRNNKDVAAALADFLTNEKAQQKRFEMTEAGPSNKKVAESDAVKNNKALAALAAQREAGGYAQLSQGSFWEPMKAFGDECASGDITTENLMTKLEDLAKAISK